MQNVTDIDAVRAIRWVDPALSWGLVPTMGYLHEGHLSLVRRARAENDRVGVSIFVNPTQFNNPADLDAYPRNVARDLTLLRAEGVDLVWSPDPAIVYPPNFQTYIEVTTLSKFLEGRHRPGHFKGVTTVVAKLFNVFQPQRAYFGQKDAQQAAIIGQMARDLNFNLNVVVCPLIREADGLALSSRNVRLSTAQRRDAPAIYAALQTAQQAFSAGEQNAANLKTHIKNTVNARSTLKVEYVSLANPHSLQEKTTAQVGDLLSLAVFAGPTRLIDNIILV